METNNQSRDFSMKRGGFVVSDLGVLLCEGAVDGPASFWHDRYVN